MTGFHTFSFDGRSLIDFGGLIRQRPRYVIAVPDIEFEGAPWKSGDRIIDNHKFKNVEFRVPIRAMAPFCKMTLAEFSQHLTEWLLAVDRTDYHIYRDTYTPGYYRKVIPTQIDEVIQEKRGVYETTITFNADPFLYSDRGMLPVTFTSNAEFEVRKTILNPEKWESLPRIKITGGGDFSCVFGDQSIIFADVTTGVIIDKTSETICDLSGNPANDIAYTLKLPKFTTGSNSVVVTGESAFVVEIVPNWRRL